MKLIVTESYEWCKENVEPQIDLLQGVDIAVIDRWMVQFETKGEFYINSLDAEADKDSDEYDILAVGNGFGSMRFGENSRDFR